MGRSRMVNDAFWKDPDLTDLTAEQRLALLLFLTCEESCVIGVYRVMWRAVGAGAGWTEPQILNVSRDLQAKDFIELDEPSGWVWVKEWWKHNSLKGAFTGNVTKKALDDLRQVPVNWRRSVINWLHENDPDGALKGLTSPLEGACESLPSSSSGADSNPTLIPTSIATTTNPVGTGIEEIEDLIEAAVWHQRKTRPMTNEARFREVVKERIAKSGANSSDLRSLENWRSEISARDAREQLQLQEQQVHAEKLAKDAASYAVALAHFESLDADAKQSALGEFCAFLEQSNRLLINLYKKDGLESKSVRTEFAKFLATNMSEV